MKNIGYIISLLMVILLMFAAVETSRWDVCIYAQSYKMMAPSEGQQVFYGVTTLANGSQTVEVLPNGTVSAAVAALASGLGSGTDTVRLAVTKSGGNITIQAYDANGTNTTSSASVNYMGGGSQ